MKKGIIALVFAAICGIVVTGGPKVNTEDARIWPWKAVAEAVQPDAADAAVIYTFFCWRSDNSGFYVQWQSSNPASARNNCFNLLGQRYWDWDFWGNWIDCPGTGYSLERTYAPLGPGYWEGRIRRVSSDNPFCKQDLTLFTAVGIFWSA